MHDATTATERRVPPCDRCGGIASGRHRERSGRSERRGERQCAILSTHRRAQRPVHGRRDEVREESRRPDHILRRRTGTVPQEGNN